MDHKLSRRRKGWHGNERNHGGDWCRSSAMTSDGLSDDFVFEHSPENDASPKMCSTPNYETSVHLGTKLENAKGHTSFQRPQTNHCETSETKVDLDGKIFNLSDAENRQGLMRRVESYNVGDISETSFCDQSQTRELSLEQTQSELEMTLDMTQEYYSPSETESKQQNKLTDNIPAQSISLQSLNHQTRYSFQDERNKKAMSSTSDKDVWRETLHSSFDLDACQRFPQQRKTGLKTTDCKAVANTFLAHAPVARIKSEPQLDLTQAVAPPFHRSDSTKSWAGSRSSQVFIVQNMHYTNVSTEKLDLQSTDLFETKRFPELFLEPLRPLDLGDWKMLASYLKMDCFIDAIEAEVKNHSCSPIRLLMDKWWQVEGRKADVSVIKQSLEKMGRQDVLDNLEDAEKHNLSA